MPLALNTMGYAELTVGPADLADALIQDKTDDFPPVLATPRMIGLMEIAASRAMLSEVKAGELSVGVVVNITHLAATALGDTVKAEATFTGMDGKLYVFDVVAFDSGGEVGRGTHKRAVVSKERLVRGIAKRTGK